jgi:hypothetical protein
MDKIIVARKSNFSIVTWVMGIVLMIILLLVPSEFELANRLTYLAYVLIIYFITRLIIHLLKHNVLIKRDDNKLYVSTYRTDIEIEPSSIVNIEFEASKRRDINFDYGKIIISIKDKKQFMISNVAKIEEVKNELLLFIKAK